MSCRLLLPLLMLLGTAACAQRSAGFGEQADAGRDIEGDGFAADARLRAVGENCEGPIDCAGEAMCIGTSSSEYLCMAACPIPYELCDDGAACLSVVSLEAAICYTGGNAQHTEPCSSNLDCGTGLLCFGSAAQFYCRTACSTDANCDPGSFCQRLDTGAGLCRPVVGSACATADECRMSTVCSTDVTELAGLFPAGYCTTECLADTDCPDGAVCRILPGTDGTTCLSTCEHISDCRFNGGYHCLDAGSCESSSDPGACRNLFGEDSLCAPGPF